MATNEFDYVVTEEKSAAVDQKLTELEAELDLLVDLDIAARRGLSKMGRRNVDFVGRGRKHIEGNPEFLSGGLTVQTIINDIESGVWLRKVEKRIDTLADMIKDTAMLAESEAYKGIRLYYSAIKAQAKAGNEIAERIYKDLAVHYKRLGTSKTETPETEESKE